MGKRVSAFLSHLEIDPHSLCTSCHGRACTQRYTCSECIEWSETQWALMATKRKKKGKKERSSSKKDNGSRPSSSCSSVIPFLLSILPSLQQINEREGTTPIRPDSPLLLAPPLLSPSVSSALISLLGRLEEKIDMISESTAPRVSHMVRSDQPPEPPSWPAHTCAPPPLIAWQSRGYRTPPQPPAPSIRTASQASSSAHAAAPPSWPAASSSAHAAAPPSWPAAFSNPAAPASAKPATATPSSEATPHLHQSDLFSDPSPCDQEH
ncbi:uncharacterized protein [Palaemon carinicauda]|uniref:uncharacterized protein n=1 Tax=Palaemon carinicauda TaxID=392227 RepID=UPI0035B57EBE